MIERPKMSPAEYRRKVESGEIVQDPRRNPWEPSILLKGGNWLQEQEGRYILFWDYYEFKILEDREVIKLLEDEIKKLKNQYERTTPFCYRN